MEAASGDGVPSEFPVDLWGMPEGFFGVYHRAFSCMVRRNLLGANCKAVFTRAPNCCAMPGILRPEEANGNAVTACSSSGRRHLLAPCEQECTVDLCVAVNN